MKSTGMVRAMDTLGRVVIPKEMRETCDIQINDPLEIYYDDNSIILRKYQPGCVICKSMDDTVPFKGKLVCRECIEGIKADLSE